MFTWSTTGDTWVPSLLRLAERQNAVTALRLAGAMERLLQVPARSVRAQTAGLPAFLPAQQCATSRCCRIRISAPNANARGQGADVRLDVSEPAVNTTPYGVRDREAATVLHIAAAAWTQTETTGSRLTIADSQRSTYHVRRQSRAFGRRSLNSLCE